MRGMIKWKPFNSLLKENDILEIEKNKTLITKPVIMEDKINSINYTIKEAINNNNDIYILYFYHGMIKRLYGKINKVNIYEKYILINQTRIYMKNLIDIQIL